MSPNKKLVLWHRLVRWALGAFFIGIGSVYFSEGAWPVLLFGVAIMVTGFFKQRRCLVGTCDITDIR
ncbi:MAG: hypothetical protein ACTHLE_03045 [Agriterribacter sp.]